MFKGNTDNDQNFRLTKFGSVVENLITTMMCSTTEGPFVNEPTSVGLNK